MNRWDIINQLIRENHYTRYLEVGVLGNENFSNVDISHKDSVDPNGQAKFTMTSDKFFATLPKDKFYDIIFIDGLHLEEQVSRDIENSLLHLSDNGSIVVHDCLPEEEYQQLRTPRPCFPWTGDGWKAWAALRMSRDDINMHVVNVDWGCGVIQRGSQELFQDEYFELTWEYFSANKEKLMNISEHLINSRHNITGDSV